MPKKPLLALVAMCRAPYRYIGSNLDMDARMYLRHTSDAVAAFIAPKSDQKTVQKGTLGFKTVDKKGKKRLKLL